MANKAKQRFVDLVVDEVSLVDSPANEQQFVVIKNLTEEVGEMPDKEEVTKGLEEPQNKGTKDIPEKVSVEVEKANNDAIAAAMEQVNKMIGSIAKAVDEASKIENTVQDGGKSEEKSVNKSSGEEEGSKNEIVKNSDGEDSDSVDAVEKTLAALGCAVEKAKRFTPKREEAFKAALAALTSLAKELGMMEIPVGQSPSTNTPKGTMFGASSISKSLELLTSKVEEAISGMQETTKRLNEKVEQIEKARKPSNSIEGDGGTDAKTVKKNFWSGIL